MISIHVNGRALKHDDQKDRDQVRNVEDLKSNQRPSDISSPVIEPDQEQDDRPFDEAQYGVVEKSLSKEHFVREYLILHTELRNVSSVIAVPGNLHPDGCSADLRSRDDPSGYNQHIV